MVPSPSSWAGTRRPCDAQPSGPRAVAESPPGPERSGERPGAGFLFREEAASAAGEKTRGGRFEAAGLASKVGAYEQDVGGLMIFNERRRRPHAPCRE